VVAATLDQLSEDEDDTEILDHPAVEAVAPLANSNQQYPITQLRMMQRHSIAK
jgi:hypothetical protein